MMTDPTAPLLVVRDLTRRFGGVTAVDGLGFTVGPRERLAVIGPNGAGKSTLLRMIAGHDRPSAGQIELEGVGRIDGKSPHSLTRSGIALARQIPRPLGSLTVAQNVEVGIAAGSHRRTGSATGRIAEILELTRLSSVADRRASQLPLLDLKRLEVARALASDPELLLLDEVSAGLTEAELDDAIDMLLDIHERGGAMLIVEHVQEVVRRLSERVLVLNWGKLIAEGSHAEVTADPEVKRVYLGDGRSAASHSPAGAAPSGGDGLVVTNLAVRRGNVVALRDVSIRVSPGQVVTILGANGAGKTSLAQSISGVLPIAGGSVQWEGREIAELPSFRRAALGIAHCQEGRKLFPGMTVLENLQLGAFGRTSKQIAERLDEVFQVFPVLADRVKQVASTMSGGQQQMVAIGRALMSRPRLLLLDEVTLGLSPKAADEIYSAVATVASSGTSVVLVEQDAHRSLSFASYAYILSRGFVHLEGRPDQLSTDDLAAAYLGDPSTASPAPTAPEPDDAATALPSSVPQ